MPGNFQVEIMDNGDWVIHYDFTSKESVIARMTKDGYYFDKLDSLKSNPDYKPPDLEKVKGELYLPDEELIYLKKGLKIYEIILIRHFC